MVAGGASHVNTTEKVQDLGKIGGATLTFKKSTSTLPSIPLFEVDNGHIGTQGHLWPTLTQAVSALELTCLGTAIISLNSLLSRARIEQGSTSVQLRIPP